MLECAATRYCYRVRVVTQSIPELPARWVWKAASSLECLLSSGAGGSVTPSLYTSSLRLASDAVGVCVADGKNIPKSHTTAVPVFCGFTELNTVPTQVSV